MFDLICRQTSNVEVTILAIEKKSSSCRSPWQHEKHRFPEKLRLNFVIE
jgi:hypothetical protein